MTSQDADLCGLTEAVAQTRLAVEGPNTLPQKERRGLARICLEVLREPMFGLLAAGGVVYLALGEAQDAAVLIAFATLSVGIAILQQWRSERVLGALRDLSAPQAVVIRDGLRKSIPGAGLVRDDIVAVAEGDRAPADAVVLEASDLQVDESLLTGESAPVVKVADADAVPVSPDAPAAVHGLYAGSLIVRGHALARVVSTGGRTELGRIGGSLVSIMPQSTALALQVRQVVQVLGIVAFALSLIVLLAVGLTQGTWLEGLLAGLALGMTMIPEEFPLVLTVFMVMGAWRISRVGVLARRASAIESLGSASVLCADKTGTLTQNHMTLARGWVRGAAANRDALPALARIGALASAPSPFDPMERAFHDAAPGASEGLRLARAYGLRPELLAVTQAWSEGGGQGWRIAAKGAPEAIAGLCGASPALREEILAAAGAMGEEGMRVLGLAEGRFDGQALPDSPTGFALTFSGLVGLADPLRADVPQAVAACRAAGIRVVMVTGDYPSTARAIARQAGIAAAEVITGPELESLSDTELAGRVRSVTVFARILPEQKLRIVRAFQGLGEVVAMTGDGVNDAPALRAADIGIAMGRRGAEVAREAAALVLMKDGFAPIVETVRLGRRIYDNLGNVTRFILSVHVPIAGLALLPLLTGGGLILAPIHIAFLEMMIDPVCSIAFEAEPAAPGLMNRPPRPAGQRLFERRRVLDALGQGFIALAGVMGVYAAEVSRGSPAGQVAASAFASLVLADIALLLTNRGGGGGVRAIAAANRWLLSIVAVTLGLLAAALWLEPVRSLFGFAPLDARSLLTVGVATAAVALTLRLLKTLSGQGATRPRTT